MIAALQHRAGEYIQERYEVLGVLGSGAFGTVYRCRDHELDTFVAIKELHVLDDPGTVISERTRALAQFRREALHLSRLRHPHIVSGHYQPHNSTWLVCPVCGFTFLGTKACPAHNATPIVLKQRNYLVMEYLDGPNLSQAAEQSGGALPIESAVRYIRQTSEALRLIHERGWVHRDVKPENIRLRAATDEAVLLDFGIATQSGAAGDFSTRAQRHTTGGGTLGYAPDTAEERRHPDARSDIHALGMTLYHLASGRDPLEFEELLAMRKFPPRHFNTQITPELEVLILRAINPHPANRPANGAEFLRELDALGEKKIPTPPAPSPEPAATLASPTSLRFDSGEQPRTLQQLVELCDCYPVEARAYLFNSEIERWLLEENRGILARRAREIREKYSRRERALEAFLQATGEAEPPRLQADQSFLDFGEVHVGEVRTLKLRLQNNGRGYLFGVLRASHQSLQAPHEFDGNEATIPIALDARRLARGVYSGELTIDSSAGELRIPFRANVKNAARSALSGVVSWAVFGMIGGCALRTLPLISHSSLPGWGWLKGAPPGLTMWPISPLFGITLFAVLTPFLVAESLRRKSCSTAFSLALFTVLLSIFCSFLGLEILIGGDALLRPYLHQIARNWAAGGWMFVGGVLGAAYGTLQQWHAVFSARLLQILLGWLAAMALLYGVLAAVTLIVPHWGF
jgi:serine/threonine protein kinase